MYIFLLYLGNKLANCEIFSISKCKFIIAGGAEGEILFW